MEILRILYGVIVIGAVLVLFALLYKTEPKDKK